ncbi:hypothetical protein SAMN04488074_116126 [Lentzea albidocapillata subsp. violacea]|uniref:MYXO-CTERM domain-containing protein n=1 Tax=Lentzea albidocapillata subsp. violacea TaxID=128104 RepID=A0A1G9QE25_9PSEU|nr:hypothetical protein [Lentzea albidocapillata]SDM09332.1 hypothetical protein SAMN04488074_116126 [Lentzea albidocapillata subsp. violacea]
MVKPLHIASALALAVAGALLLFSSQEKTASTQVTSTTVPSGSPGAGWTEEEMRNASGQDMTAGPSVEALVAGGAVLAALTILLVARRRSAR